VKVEHFALEYSRGETVRVFDRAGTALAEFPAPKKGEFRRWQELQLAFVQVLPDSVLAEVEFKPGSPCFGSGRYLALRQGLQILFPGDRSVRIEAWDAAKPEVTLRLQGPSGSADVVVNPESSTGEAFKLRWRLESDGSLDLRELN
jgi:hypothetical protein